MIDRDTAEKIAVENYAKIYQRCYSESGANEQAAQDITQEVFKIFYEKLNVLNNDKIESWLNVVARNKLFEYYRKIKEEQRILLYDENMLLSLEDMFVMFDEYLTADDEQIEKYKQIVLKGLSKNDRELYNMVYVQKMSYKEIGKIIGLTHKAVGARVLRMRKRLQKLVKLMFSPLGQLFIRIFF